MTSVKIKKAGLADCLALARMNHDLIQDSGHRNPMEVPQLSRRMRNWVKRGNYQVCLFEAEGMLVGYCVYRKEREFIYIRQFFIDRKLRRKSFGRRAFGMMRKLHWKGRLRLRMDVLVDNVPAIRFWRAVGFKDYCLTMERENA